MLNDATFTGRAGRDPETKYLESGKIVTNLTLAVNRRGKDLPPDWVNLVAWDRTAEVFAKHVRKGDLIGVEANLKFETWNDRETGEERSKAVFQVERLDLLAKKGGSGNSQNDDADYGEYDDDF
jgi:single-strand DNA-binding protein